MTNEATGDSSSILWRPREWLTKAAAGDSRVQEVITADLKTVRSKLENELEYFNKKRQSEKEARDK